MALPTQILARRFELLELLVQDHLGQSFRALDQQLHSAIRLKLLHSQLARDPLLRRQFRHELLVLRQLSHPNILAGYELGEEGELLFYTTEPPPGPPLSRIPLPLDTETCFQIARALLDALAHAHGRGVIHADVQPRHVYWGKGRLKLGGFSAAELWPLASLNAAIPPGGVLRYSAPEVLRGAAPSGRADLYSAGLVLGEILSGRVWFAQESLKEQIQAKLQPLPNLLEKLPPPLRGAHLWKRLLSGLLAPDPQARFRDAGQALEALGERCGEDPFALGKGQPPDSWSRREQELIAQTEAIAARLQEQGSPKFVSELEATSKELQSAMALMLEVQRRRRDFLERSKRPSGASA